MWGLMNYRDQQVFIQSLFTCAQKLIPWQQQWQYQTPSGKIKYLSAIAQLSPQPNGDLIWDGLIVEIPSLTHNNCCPCYPETFDLEAIATDQIEQVLSWFEPSDNSMEPEKAEAVLEEQEEFLRNIYNGLEQVIFVVEVINEKDFRSLGWNPKTEQITGLKSAEVYGKTFTEILGLTEGEKVLQNYRDCVQAKTSIQYEEEIWFEQKQTFSLTTLNPILDPRGKIYRIIGTSLDITARKKAEIALQQSQIRFQQLAENVPGVTYQYHQYNHQGQGCFTYLSPKCLELTEIRPEVILKNADFLWKLIHPDDLNAFVDSMAQAVDTGKPWQHQYRLIIPSGKIKWIQAGGSLGKQADGSIVWDGLLLDISDRKQTETAWQSSEKQLRELAEREKMQNCIANLIRNSLDWNTILETTVQEIRQLLGIDRCYFVGYNSELNPPEWEILKESKAPNLVSISEMYPGNALHPISQIDESELKNIDLHENLDSTLMLLESRLKEQPYHPAIQLIKQYGNLPHVECYAGELNQVFMNLLANAIDAVEQRNKRLSLKEIIADQGVIWITTLLTDSQRVQIRIADNGIGMSAEVLAKIFDPFFTTKDVGLGTGLGMSTSYKIIVETHKGQLSCVSEVGLGTECVIEIPRLQPR
jgi:PAS domain S-box-containing protein